MSFKQNTTKPWERSKYLKMQTVSVREIIRVKLFLPTHQNRQKVSFPLRKHNRAKQKRQQQACEESATARIKYGRSCASIIVDFAVCSIAGDGRVIVDVFPLPGKRTRQDSSGTAACVVQVNSRNCIAQSSSTRLSIRPDDITTMWRLLFTLAENQKSKNDRYLQTKARNTQTANSTRCNVGEKNRQCNKRHRTPATVTNAANPRPPELGLCPMDVTRITFVCSEIGDPLGNVARWNKLLAGVNCLRKLYH